MNMQRVGRRAFCGISVVVNPSSDFPEGTVLIAKPALIAIYEIPELSLAKEWRGYPVLAGFATRAQNIAGSGRGGTTAGVFEALGFRFAGAASPD